MGLFSFLKNVGSKVLSNKAEEKAEAAADSAEVKRHRESLLTSVVQSSGIKVDNLAVELDDDKATVYGQTDSVDDKEKIVLILGNTEGIATVDDRLSVVAPPQSRFYEVQSGDSLSKIAKEMYGDPMKYNEIFEANKPMLSDPNKIYPGQQLRIPNL
jgi:LysM repeat protein